MALLIDARKRVKVRRSDSIGFALHLLPQPIARGRRSWEPEIPAADLAYSGPRRYPASECRSQFPRRASRPAAQASRGAGGETKPGGSYGSSVVQIDTDRVLREARFQDTFTRLRLGSIHSIHSLSAWFWANTRFQDDILCPANLAIGNRSQTNPE